MKTDKRLRIEALNEQLNPSKLISEGAAPATSVYGKIQLMWKEIVSIISKNLEKKYVNIKPHKPIGAGMYMASLDGTTKSDVTLDGWVSMWTATNKQDNMQIECSTNNVLRGKNVRDWYMGFGDDYKSVAKEVAAHINQQLGM